MEDEIAPSGEPDEGYAEEEERPSSELKTQKFYFRIYKNLPEIFAIIAFVLIFAWGIFDACKLHIMGIESGFLTWIIWTLIAFACCVLIFLACSVFLSPKILQIYYLQKISGEKNRVLDDDD